MKSVSLAVTILVIVALAALTIWVLQFVYLIMGWSKIKNSGLSSKIKAVQMEDIEEEEEVIEKEGEAIEEVSEEILENEQFRVAGNETPTDSKKWLLWGGIGAAVVALFLIIWFAWLSPSGNNEELRYVYTQSMAIHNTPSEYADEVSRLNFGKQVTIIDYVNGGDWVKVTYLDEGGTFKEGYALLTNLVTYGDFDMLKHAGFDHVYVQQAIQSQGQRKAVIDYFSQNQGDSIKIVSPSFEGVCALAESCAGVETLAFVAGKEYTPDVLVVYTIDESGQPHLYSQNKMPKDAEGIKSIAGSDGDIHVTLTPARGSKGISMSLEEVENSDESTPGYEEPAGDEYTHVYAGTINGKYAIEMTLTTDGGAYYTGEYFYTKNRTPIQLRGQLTDDYEHLVLEEYVGMNMTGKFEGTLSPKRYYGTWTSADGETTYPFEITAK